MKYHLVLNKCGEGVVFQSEVDARSAMKGGFRRMAMWSALAEAFHDAYPKGNKLLEIEVDSSKRATP